MQLQRLPLIEPVPIDYELCTDIAAIEEVKSLGACFVLCAEDTLHETGERVRVVKHKIVVPIEAIASGIGMARRFLAKHRRNVGQRRLWLVG